MGERSRLSPSLPIAVIDCWLARPALGYGTSRILLRPFTTSRYHDCSYAPRLRLVVVQLVIHRLWPLLRKKKKTPPPRSPLVSLFRTQQGFFSLRPEPKSDERLCCWIICKMIRGRGVARAQAHGTQFNLTLLSQFAFFQSSLTEPDTHLLRTASCSVARFTHIAEHQRNGERNWMRPAVVCLYPGTTRSLRSKATFSITVGRWPYTNVHHPLILAIPIPRHIEHIITLLDTGMPLMQCSCTGARWPE